MKSKNNKVIDFLFYFSVLWLAVFVAFWGGGTVDPEGAVLYVNLFVPQILFLVLLVLVLGRIFRDKRMDTTGKFNWTIGLIVVPLLVFPFYYVKYRRSVG